MISQMFHKDDESNFRNGGAGTTQIGYTNRNAQRCDGHRGLASNDHGQKAYKVTCLKCSNEYGANGTDIWLRRCPACEGGKPGIAF